MSIRKIVLIQPRRDGRFLGRGISEPYMLPPMFAKIIAVKNRISNPLNKGFFLRVFIFIL